MNPLARSALDGSLLRSPLQPVFHWRASRKLAVLAYHGIEDVNLFARHLDLLSEAWHPVSVDEVIRAATGRGALPRRAVLITFDDGHRSILELGMPLLVDRGFPAAAFVVAGLLDGDLPHWTAEVSHLVGGEVNEGRTRPLALIRSLKQMPNEERLATIRRMHLGSHRDWNPVPQLRSSELPLLESGGILVGNHTLTHACLSRCGDDEILREVGDAHRMIASALGHPPRAFAYPDGEYDRRAATILSRFGYEISFLFDHRLSAVPPPVPLAISRLRIDSTSSVDRLRMVLSGLHPALHRLRGKT
jgi:peptidoglycan/xylan/chitin deacetylase (PgdA/CDA1 family)